MNQIIYEIKNYLPSQIYDSICHGFLDKADFITEIRLRLGKFSTLTLCNKNVILKATLNDQPIILSEKEIQSSFNKICENSLYKYEKEIKLGYITLKNGCRAGFCGSKTDSGLIRDISSINLRIARTVIGASKCITDAIFDGYKIFSTLIVGPPCSGKTTILSDLSRFLCLHNFRVSIVDERSEIGAVHRGIPQKIVGDTCDVLDGYPKGEGMMIALRCLSPQVIICDEVGTQDDVLAMIQAYNGGVPVIASAHADSIESLRLRPQIFDLIKNCAIDKIILLSSADQPGKVKTVVSAGELYENNWNHSNSVRWANDCQKSN